MMKIKLPKTTLICSAIKEEVDQILKLEKFTVFVCGIGNLEAGLNLQRFLLDCLNNKKLNIPYSGFIYRFRRCIPLVTS